MGRPKGIKTEEIIDYLKLTGKSYRAAAKFFDCSPTTIFRHVQKWNNNLVEEVTESNTIEDILNMLRSWIKQAQKVNYNWKPNKKRFKEMEKLVEKL